MRLLRTHPIELVEFTPDRIPDYAILSHTWGEDEVLFTDMQHHTGQTKSAWSKVQGACAQARADGFAYIWIDTCCIDKSSSAELSEAINSMFTWYANAAVCYAYIFDVTATPGHYGLELDTSEFEKSRWFTRGWTLQELLAPSEVVFFSQGWVRFGERSSLAHKLMSITRIDEAILSRELPLFERSIAQRMSWAARRQTTRPEDMAYCLMGIFSVNMPMLYGEGGEKAFLRLQEEIMKQSDDHTIFAWTDKSAPADLLHGLLASSPAHFANSQNMVPYQQLEPTPPYAMTNRGLRIDLSLNLRNSARQPRGSLILAVLHCGKPPSEGNNHNGLFFGIYLKRLSEFDNRYARVMLGCRLGIPIKGRTETIYVPQGNIQPDKQSTPAYITFRFDFMNTRARVVSPTINNKHTEDFTVVHPARGRYTTLAFLIFQYTKEFGAIVMLASSPDLTLGFLASRRPASDLHQDFDTYESYFSGEHSGERRLLLPMGEEHQVHGLIVRVRAVKEHRNAVSKIYNLGINYWYDKSNRDSGQDKIINVHVVRNL